MVDEPTSSLPDANDASTPRDAFRSAFGFDDAMDSRWMEIAREATTETTSLGRLGRYELLAEAGRGGQGIVYKAKQPGTNRTIAIKRLSAGVHASDASRARFHREVSLVASLDHPGIVSVLGMEEVPGELGTHELLLMEWVDGMAIDHWADAQSRWQDVLPVFVQVCDAVAFAHQRGVMHRDLKPSNILVDGTGRARVLDFGLARPTGPNLTISRTTGFVGTPAFASPEAVGISTSSLSGSSLRNGAGALQGIDTRSDIFSLGAVLYRLLTKREPFDSSRGIGPLFDAIRVTEPKSPRGIVRELPRELEAIVLKALRKLPSDRYQSVDAFATDLRRFLAGETVVAVPPSLGYQLRSLVRRHRAASVVAVAGLVGVLLFAGTATWLAIRLGKERDALAAAQVEIKHKSSEAEAALRDALLKSNQQQSTSAFLTSILGEVDNLQEGDRAVTLKELLDRAAQRLRAGELADQPEEEVRLLLTIAEAMRGIAQYDAGIEIVNDALARAKRNFGERSELVARAHHNLGLLYEADQNTIASLSHYLQCEDLYREIYGPTNPLTTTAFHNVGVGLRGLGYTRDALERYCETWAKRAEMYGELSAESISAQRGVVVAYRSLNDTKTAAALAADALARAQQQQLPSRILITLLVADSLDQQKQSDDALRMRLDALEECRSQTPVDSSLLIRCLQAVARAHVARNELDLAGPYLLESSQISDNVYGKGHWHSVRTRVEYARALCGAARVSEGLEILFEQYDKYLLIDSPNVLRVELAGALADELAKAGYVQEAMTYREEHAEGYDFFYSPANGAVSRWESFAKLAGETGHPEKREYSLTRALACEQSTRNRPSKLVDLSLSLCEIRRELGNDQGAQEAFAQATGFAGDDQKLTKRVADWVAK
ncbi:MAG: serine/threonine-protein kinase [Phycisphaerales bacterium]